MVEKRGQDNQIQFDNAFNRGIKVFYIKQYKFTYYIIAFREITRLKVNFFRWNESSGNGTLREWLSKVVWKIWVRCYSVRDLSPMLSWKNP